MGLFENIGEPPSTIGHRELAGLHVGVRVGGRYDHAEPATVAFT
jgi:hypothetical protein